MLTIQYAKNPFYNNPQNSTIFLTVKFVEFDQELPFTASPTDDTSYGPVLYTNAINGDYGVVGSWNQNPHYAPPFTLPTSLPNAKKDVAYSQALTAFNSLAPATIVAITELPAGLNIVNNVVVGTPTNTGNFSFDVRTTDALDNSGVTTLVLTVV
jgi:hypothetical protein